MCCNMQRTCIEKKESYKCIGISRISAKSTRPFFAFTLHECPGPGPRHHRFGRSNKVFPEGPRDNNRPILRSRRFPLHLSFLHVLDSDRRWAQAESERDVGGEEALHGAREFGDGLQVWA